MSRKAYPNYEPPRPLEEIEADIRSVEKEIADMLEEVAE